MNFFFLRVFVFSIINVVVLSAQDFDYSSLTISADLKKNANAVVRLDSKIMTILSVDDMEISYRRVVTVFNKSGNRLVKAGVGYDDSRKVIDIEARIYDQLGNEIKKIKSKDFSDESAISGGTLYSDSRVLCLDYNPVSYPYTVDFTYTLKTSVTVFIPSWTPVLNYYQSVEKATYTINNLMGSELFFKKKNFEGYGIENTTSDNSIHYKVHNIQAIKPEDLSPSVIKFVPRLLVACKEFNANGVLGQASDWKEYGKWMYEKILSGRQQLAPETANSIKQLTANVEDPIEKAKIVYNFVQDNTRYISVQVGIGGYQPISAAAVDEVKYGDCKGLTNYTQALLETVGVSAYYTHVESGRRKMSLEDDFASLSQGDHVILNIPYKGKDYWLDCTSQIHPFGFVGDFTDDRDVLVMTPEGGIIKHTPRYLDTTNVLKTSALIKLDDKGALKGNVEIQATGIEYDNRFYMERLGVDDQVKHYKNHWNYINNLKVFNIQFQNLKDRILFEETLDIEALAYGTMSGNRILFAPNVFNKETRIPNRYRNRTLDFEIERGYFHEAAFEIKLPEGYIIEAKPENLIAKSKYGIYKAIIEIKDGTVYYKRSFLEKHGAYGKEEYKAYRDFKRKVAGFDNAKIVLIKMTK
ncbi:DUF3857 domain-containing protein [Ascidiimonas sp. W6]|uniref:DUF3857 domain-containing protein n=1 Tax=Ascidiimonas meishanensis TaxID=3128903 RepID=UPI0030ED1887